MKLKHNKELVNDNWDGQKIEEHKMMDSKLTSPKSRLGWSMPPDFCPRRLESGDRGKCANDGIACKDCFGCSMYKEDK